MAKHGVHEDGMYVLSAQTCVSQRNDETFTFNNAFVITNDGSAGYYPAKQNAIRYSADVTYTITIPSDLQVTQAQLRGYCNYGDEDAYIASWNSTTYTANQYFFPRADEGDSQWVTYYIDHSANPVTDSLSFMISGRQTSLLITLTCVRRSTQGVESGKSKVESRKIIRNGQIVIIRDGKEYNLLGNRY